MADVTVIILTKNEEINLPDCLLSVRGFAKRVVVVDSGSTDRTQAIARESGAEVLTHGFTYHAAQFNWALDNLSFDTKWVMRIDADERMTPECLAEAERVMEKDDPEVTGIVMQADFYLLGRALKHGMAKKRKIVLFRTGCGRSEDRYIDEHMLILRGHTEEVRHHYIHRDAKDLSDFARKLEWYSGREVRDVLEREGRSDLGDEALRRTARLKDGFYYKAPPFLRAGLLFLYAYIIRLGFLDGTPGLVYNFMYCNMYRFLVDAKLYEAKQKKERGE